MAFKEIKRKVCTVGSGFCGFSAYKKLKEENTVIALIGASNDKQKYGNKIYQKILILLDSASLFPQAWIMSTPKSTRIESHSILINSCINHSYRRFKNYTFRSFI